MHADARKIFAVATGSASQIGLSAVAALVTTLFLPVDDRGRYVLLVTVIGVTAPLAGLGSNVGLRRLRPTTRFPRCLESAYLAISSGGALLHGLLTVPILLLVTHSRIPNGPGEALAAVGLAIGQTFSWQFVELWYARLQFRLGAIYATANAATGLIAALIAYLTPSFFAVIAVQASTGLVLHGWQAIHIHRSRANGVEPSHSRTGIGFSMVRMGAPSLVMTVGMSLTFRVDRLILGLLGGPRPVAIYALAGSFAELPRFIPASFGQIANGRAAMSPERLRLRPYLLPAFGLTLLAGGAAMGAGYWFMHRIRPEYMSSFAPSLVLLLGELALTPYSIVIRMIVGGGRIGLSARVGLVAIVLSAATYWFAISRFGIMGAAVASLTAYSGISAACVWIHFRQGK